MEKLDSKKRELFLSRLIEIGGECDNPRLFSKIVLGSIEETDGVRDALQNVIGHLVENGYTKNEIETMWNDMMIQRRKIMNYNIACTVEWWEGLKIGEDEINVDLAARDLVFSRFYWIAGGMYKVGADRAYDCPVIYTTKIKRINSVLMYTDYDWRKEEGAVRFKKCLILALSQGRIGAANFLLLQWGDEFKLSCVNGRNGLKCPKTVIKDLIQEAIPMAEEKGRYGIACALAEFVGDIVKADFLRAKAREKQQRISLDYYFYVEDYNNRK